MECKILDVMRGKQNASCLSFINGIDDQWSEKVINSMKDILKS